MTRALTVFFLMLALAISVPRDACAQSDEAGELSSAQEQEATDFTVRLMKRLNETDDFAPLLDEFFISDFTGRLKQFIREQDFTDEDFRELGLERQILLQADDADLRRAYVALLNFWNLRDVLDDTAWDYVSVTNEIKDRVELYKPPYEQLHRKIMEDALTPDYVSTAKSDPLVAALVFGLVLDSPDEEAGDEEVHKSVIIANRINSIARLRDFTSTLEKCVALMRAGVTKLREEQKLKARFPRLLPERDRETYHIYKSWMTTLETGAAGFPAGTQFFFTRIFPFEILMTRRDGQLLIVAVYPDIDGD